MNQNTIRALASMSPRPTLHLGHYWSALVNWRKMQYQYDCFFMVADTNQFIIDFQQQPLRQQYVYNTVIDWLAAGIDPSQATIFIQSKIPEHAELVALLSGITPLGWLERIPGYKEISNSLEHTDLSSFGRIGLPLFYASALLCYDVTQVAIKDSEVAQVEFAREIARRFNFLYGREDGFEQLAEESIKKLGTKKAAMYRELLAKFQQDGEDSALEKARYLLLDAINLQHNDRERLFAFLENKGRVFLNEPQIISTQSTRVTGLDGQKMSHRNDNTINLHDKEHEVCDKIRGMVTDPARVRRVDKGNPNACPVWTLHSIYSSQEVRDWAEMGCLSASIGCLDCKGPLIDEINRQQQIFQDNAKPYQEDLPAVKRIISDGCQRARDIAAGNLKKIRQAMDIDY